MALSVYAFFGLSEDEDLVDDLLDGEDETDGEDDAEAFVDSETDEECDLVGEDGGEMKLEMSRQQTFDGRTPPLGLCPFCTGSLQNCSVCSKSACSQCQSDGKLQPKDLCFQEMNHTFQPEKDDSAFTRKTLTIKEPKTIFEQCDRCGDSSDTYLECVLCKQALCSSCQKLTQMGLLLCKQTQSHHLFDKSQPIVNWTHKDKERTSPHSLESNSLLTATNQRETTLNRSQSCERVRRLEKERGQSVSDFSQNSQSSRRSRASRRSRHSTRTTSLSPPQRSLSDEDFTPQHPEYNSLKDRRLSPEPQSSHIPFPDEWRFTAEQVTKLRFFYETITNEPMNEDLNILFENVGASGTAGASISRSMISIWFKYEKCRRERNGTNQEDLSSSSQNGPKNVIFFSEAHSPVSRAPRQEAQVVGSKGCATSPLSWMNRGRQSGAVKTDLDSKTNRSNVKGAKPSLGRKGSIGSIDKRDSKESVQSDSDSRDVSALVSPPMLQKDSIQKKRKGKKYDLKKKLHAISELFKDGASLTAFVSTAVLEEYRTSDMFLMSIILLTHPYFSDSCQLLDILLRQFSAATELFLEKVLTEWFTKYKDDWTTDLQKELFHFIETDEYISKNVRERLKSTFKSISTSPRVVSPRISAPIQGTALVSGLKWDPPMLAGQLFLLHQEMLSEIPPRQFFDWLNLKSKKTEYENIHRMTSHFNHLALWVVSEIVVLIRKAERVTLMEKYIQLTEICLNLNNFFGAKAIFSGLTHPAITRMNATYDALNRGAIFRLEKLREILSFDSDDDAAYRALLAKADPPFVPFLDLHLKDMTFVNDSSVNKVGDLMINIKKFINLGKPVLMFMKGASEDFFGIPDPGVQSYLSNCPCLSDDNLFHWSNRVEPSDFESLIEELLRGEASSQQKIKSQQAQIENLMRENKSLTEHATRLKDQLGRFKIQITEGKKEKKVMQSKFLESIHERDLVIERLKKKLNEFEGERKSLKKSLVKTKTCSRCSAATSCKKCSGCRQLFCGSCQQLKSLLNPCLDGKEHLYITREKKEKVTIVTEVNCKNCHEVSVAALLCSHCSYPFCPSCQKLSSLGMLTCSKGKMHTFEQSTRRTVQAKPKKNLIKERNCERCGTLSIAVRDCLNCSQAFCETCQKLKRLKNPCSSGLEHRYEQVDSCDRCSSTTLPFVRCLICRQAYCGTCQRLSQLKNPCTNGLAHKFDFEKACEKCSAIAGLEKCLKCHQLYCNQCQRLKRLKNPCANGLDHLFLPTDLPSDNDDHDFVDFDEQEFLSPRSPPSLKIKDSFGSNLDLEMKGKVKEKWSHDHSPNSDYDLFQDEKEES